MVGRFVIRFFSIGRAETKEINALSLEFYQLFQRFIRNLKVDKNEFISGLLSAFNDFHSQITTLQAEKTQEGISLIKNKFPFATVHHRFLVKDLQLADEEYLFTEAMFKTTAFTAENFFKEFDSHLKDFILGYSEVTERIIKGIIDQIMQGFSHHFEKILSVIKKTVSDQITKLIETIVPARLSLLMYEINEDLEERKYNWEVVYEEFIDKEHVCLKQAVPLSENHLLITLSLKDSDQLMVISNKQYVSRCLEDTIPDSNTIIASGSTIDSLIYLSNSQRRGTVSCYTNENKIVLRREIQIYHESISEITSACYLKLGEEIVYIYNHGDIGQFSISKKPLTRIDEIVPTLYRAISLSLCQRFIVLLSEHEAYLYSHNLHLMYMDHSYPYFASIRGIKFIMIYLEQPNGSNIGNSPFEISINSVTIDSESKLNAPEVNIINHRIDSIGHQTMNLAKELFGGVFQTRNFNDINVPDLAPK